MKVTRDLLKMIRPEINRALAEIGENHNIDLKLANGKFTENTFQFKLEGAVLLTDTGLSPAAAEWNRYRAMYGLNAIEYGDKFTMANELYTISGLKLKSPKYPVLADNARGVTFKFTP